MKLPPHPPDPNAPPHACCLCGKSGKDARLVAAALIRPSIADLIVKRVPDWGPGKFICAEDLGQFRTEYMQTLMRAEKGELSEIEREVFESLRDNDILSRGVDAEFDSARGFGERIADHIAAFGGSWTFILSFGAAVLAWMLLNTFLLVTRAFDPFPYILLNLILSCLAAIQAPVIMMSQRRQEARDRARATHDYQINLKAELEIRHLHQKIDHMLSTQWERLVEIQEIQIEIMRELEARRK